MACLANFSGQFQSKNRRTTKKSFAESTMQGPKVFHSYASWRLKVKDWRGGSESRRTCDLGQLAQTFRSRGRREGGVEVHRRQLPTILENEATICGCRWVIGCYVHVVSYPHNIYRALKAKGPAGLMGITVAKNMRLTNCESDLGVWDRQRPSSQILQRRECERFNPWMSIFSCGGSSKIR